MCKPKETDKKNILVLLHYDWVYVESVPSKILIDVELTVVETENWIFEIGKKKFYKVCGVRQEKLMVRMLGNKYSGNGA